MPDTSARLLALLALLQARPRWPGPELAARLGVSTARSATTSPGCASSGTPSTRCAARPGTTALGVGAELRRCCSTTRRRSPSRSGCGRATGSPARGVERRARWPSSSRCCRTGCAARSPRCTRRPSSGPGEHGSDAADPRSTRGAGRSPPPIRGRSGCASTTATTPAVVVEPYRLVSWQRRWYLVGREPDRAVERASGRPDRPCGCRRAGVHAGAAARGDYTAFVVREVASTGWTVHARIRCWRPRRGGAGTDQPGGRRRRTGRRRESRAGHRRRQPRGAAVTSACSAWTSTWSTRRSWPGMSARSASGTCARAVGGGRERKRVL